MERERIIFHIDVNSAFLSWSAVKRLAEDPDAEDLRTVPSAVGGDISTRHGVITAKSIPAKSFGVVTGEAVVSALKKCPDLMIVASDFETYRKYSRAFIDILRKYSSQLEQASIDEAYLDVTERLSEHPQDELRTEARRLADLIRADVRDSLGFTVNIGISSNKLLAKMASDFRKPDMTHTLWPEETEEKMWPLPVSELYGCGAKTAEKLRKAGILTIGDAARSQLWVLQSVLGDKMGDYIHSAAGGIGSSAVETVRQDARSYSNEMTTGADITRDNYRQEIPGILKYLSGKVSGRMRRDGVYGDTISVSIKTSGFVRRSRQIKISSPTNDPDAVYARAAALMDQLVFGTGTDGSEAVFDTSEGLRLVGVGVSGLEKKENHQISIDDYLQERESADRAAAEKRRRRELDSLVREIREKFGDGAVSIGTKHDIL